MKQRLYHIAALGSWLLAFSLLAVSCADDMTSLVFPEGGKSGQSISFTVKDKQDWLQQSGDETLTRAVGNGCFDATPLQTVDNSDRLVITPTVVNGINPSTVNRIDREGQPTRGIATNKLTGSFGVGAFEYEPGSDLSSAICLFWNEAATTSDDVTWDIPHHYWPSAVNFLQCFAYAPYQAANSSAMSVFQTGTEGRPYIVMNVPEEIENQVDLMTAVTTPKVYERDYTIDLPFKHVMTCVRFALGTGFPAGSTIKRIRLMNIVGKGTYHIGSKWELSTEASDRKNYIITRVNYDVTANSSGTILSDERGDSYATMLLLPQSFTPNSGQQIEVLYNKNDGSSDATIIADLGNTQWLPGTTVTYNLSAAANNYDYVLQVSSANVSHRGGYANVRVVSYRRPTGGGSVTPLKWRVTGYSLDNGATWTEEKPEAASWFGLATNGTGGTEDEIGYVHVSKQDPKGTASSVSASQDAARQIAVMKANGTRGENAPFDLSRHDVNGGPTLQNTANCYIINAPGTYQLPLVYGNAIKNGQPNTTAYTGSPAISHKANATINSPYIRDIEAPGGALLVWQDAENLVSAVHLDDGKENLVFTIDEDHITPGNAVVAVTNSAGTIMWSWQLWVTGQDVTETKRMFDCHRNYTDMMTVDLGWVSLGGSQAEYAGRSALVRIQQEGGQIATMKISQMSGTEIVGACYGSEPVYQWGRKDPLRPMDGNGGFKQCYSPSSRTPTYAGGPVDYKESILNPHIFYASTGSWSTVCYANTWIQGIAANAYGYQGWNYPNEEKTIYDPCPVGFKVPHEYTFFGTTTVSLYSSGTSNTNGVNSDSKTWNVSGGFNHGWNIYIDGRKNETLFFCANGYVHYDGHTIYSFNLNYFTWLTAASASGWGFQAIFGEKFYIAAVNPTAYGWGIRPVRESDWYEE